MRQLATALLLLFTMSLGAQNKETAAILKTYEKAKTEIADAKKGNNPATWMKYGKILLDAYDYPTKSLWVGLSNMEAKLVMKDEKPVSTEYKTIQGDEYEVVTYDNKALYYDPAGKLSFWTISKPVIENVDMLAEAYKAYAKASDLDAKGSNKKVIGEQMEKIRGCFLNDAMTAYSLGNFTNSSKLFESSIQCGQHPSLNTLDTTVLYYVALTANMAKEYDRSQEFFEKCLSLGFDQGGDAYAYLADCYKVKGDIEKAKEILAEGFTKHPDAQSILVNLINIYLESNDDPSKVLTYIHKAQENESNNASLYYAEGNVYKNLGDVEKAVECYQKSVEVDPNYYFGYLNMGVAYYDNAVDIQNKAADELDDSKYLAMIEDLENNLEKSIEPFEKCYSVATDEEIKSFVVEYLKNIYFRLRAKNPAYEEAYNKYNSMIKAE